MSLFLFFFRWILLVVSVIFASYLTQKLGLKFYADWSTYQSIGKLFIGTGLLALVNGTIGRILKLLTLPLSCLTFGLFSLVINAFILLWVSSFGYGFVVDGFWSAFVGSLLLSIIYSVMVLIFIGKNIGE